MRPDLVDTWESIHRPGWERAFVRGAAWKTLKGAMKGAFEGGENLHWVQHGEGPTLEWRVTIPSGTRVAIIWPPGRARKATFPLDHQPLPPIAVAPRSARLDRDAPLNDVVEDACRAMYRLGTEAQFHRARESLLRSQEMQRLAGLVMAAVREGRLSRMGTELSDMEREARDALDGDDRWDRLALWGWIQRNSAARVDRAIWTMRETEWALEA